MKKLQISIAIGIGDNVMIRSYFDTIKHQYELIQVSHHMSILSAYRDNDANYREFMFQLGDLLFSEPPYKFTKDQYPHKGQPQIIAEYNIVPQKPNLAHLLCKGSSIDITEPYIVLTTKVRFLNKKVFLPLSVKLWKTINDLSKKYKIVVMGEREVEKSKEYVAGNNLMDVYSIYDQIIANVKADRILDLTVPALGITAPSLPKLQQDCLIMSQAEFVMTVGIGGNLCLSMATAKTIGFRTDDESNLNILSSHPDISLYNDFDKFVEKLREYQ